MLHVYNPALVAAKAARPDSHAHHAHDLALIRKREARAARQAFIKSARAVLHATSQRVRKSFSPNGQRFPAGR